MKYYRLHVKKGEDPPEDWGRVLVPFAGASGLRIHEESITNCIIMCGPIIIKEIERYLNDVIEVFDYDPDAQKKINRRYEDKDEEEDELW